MSNNRFLPYEADYNVLSKCRKAESIGLWSISLLSLIIPIINMLNFTPSIFRSVIEFVDFILIVAYYILNVTTETFLYPATARKRRKGFIDNSLGSKYLEKEVEGYYTNDKVANGPFKIIVNCGENCYFTMNIAKGMLPKILIKNIGCLIIFLGMAYFGFKNNALFLPILQIILSSLFLTELIHHINFIVKLNRLFDCFKDAFSLKHNAEKTLQEAILLYLDYETTLAYNKAPLSDKVYKKMNEKLTEDWEEIKSRYAIYE